MKKIRKTIAIKEVGYMITVCDFCGESLQIEDDKEVFLLSLKKGARGLRDRKKWETKDRWYFCKECLKKQIDLEYKN